MKRGAAYGLLNLISYKHPYYGHLYYTKMISIDIIALKLNRHENSIS